MFTKFSSRYSTEEIHFNLMAVVSDRKEMYTKKIVNLTEQKNVLMEEVSLKVTFHDHRHD